MKYVGIVLTLAGIAGLVISLIAIYAIHRAADAAAKQSAMILDSTKEGVVFVRRGTAKVQILLADTNARAQTLENTLEEVASKVDKTGKTPLNALDPKVAAQFHRAQATVATLQSSMEGFQNALVLFNSISKFSKVSTLDDDKEGGDGEQLAKSLTEASEILDHISRFLNDFLSDREVTHKNLNELMDWVKQIQVKLAAAAGRVDAFRQRSRVTEERVSNSRETIPSGIEWGGVIAIVLFVSFVFTQIGLTIQGWMLWRKSASAGSIH